MDQVKNLKNVMVNSKKIMTLVMVCKQQKLLLGMKKRGFGEGRWNGFGGKLLDGETIEEGAKRELYEEVGIEAIKLNKVGIIDFEFQGNPEILEVHIFKTDSFLGEPTESEEMKPKWFDKEKIPFEKMWPDDKYWIPLFLKNKKFKCKFIFGKEDVILNKKIEEVKEI